MATGFAVAVKLIDLATGPLNNINKAIVQLNQTASKASGTGQSIQARNALNAQKQRLEQIKKTREGLKDLKDRADDVSDSFSKMFGPLGLQGIGALASAGGVALISLRFARLGSEINRTSSTLGLSTADLQKWRGAADLAGVGAEAMTTSIAQTAHGIYLMRNGLDPEMFRVVQRWGLDANKGATDAEKGANLILQVAEKIRTDPSLRNNAQAQRTLLGQLGIDERMLWLMQQGKEKIQEFAEASRRHSYLTQEQIDRSQELQFAYNGLTQSVGGFTNALAAEMAKWLTPTLKGFSEWIDKLKETPGAMKAVEVGAEALAVVFGVTAVAGVAKLIAALNAFWALPALRFLIRFPGLFGIGAGIAAWWGGGLNKGENEAIKQHPELYPTPTPVRRRHGDIFRFVPEPGEPGSGAPGAPPGAGQGPRQRRPGDYGGAIPGGATLAQYRIARDSVAGIERARYDQMGGAGGRYAGKYQFGPTEIAETATRLGEQSPTQQQFLHNPEMQERYFTNYTQDHDRYLMENSARYRGMTPAERLKVLGYAHNQGAEGAARYLDTGVAGRDAFGTSGTAYSDAIGRNLIAAGLTGGPQIATAAEPLTGGTGGGAAQGLNLDSSHRVEVHFINAPAGMRSGLTKAEGPADVSVRTHYSMDSLS